MKKCIIMPDSFKGTMTSIEVCNIISEEIANYFPNCEICKIPIADGGEGTVDAFLYAMGGKKVYEKVQGPFGDKIEGFFGIIGETAVVEMSAAAGLSLVTGKPDPANSSTYGVGELIMAAVKMGCKHIIIGLGGSCTNDAGAGMASALGTRFYDEKHNQFVPTGKTLGEVKYIDNSISKKLFKNIKVDVMCDIINPMFGINGAAYVFAPQKGADRDTVRMLDENLKRFAQTIYNEMKIDVAKLAGGGSAGGMGAGAYAFLSGNLMSGIEVMLDTIGFDKKIVNCDYIFTGEGKIDSQSFGGKVISGILTHAKSSGARIVLIAGSVEKGINRYLKGYNIYRIEEVNKKKRPFEEVVKTCKEDLRASVKQLLREL